jgi:hypothetical protein
MSRRPSSPLEAQISPIEERIARRSKSGGSLWISVPESGFGRRKTRTSVGLQALSRSGECVVRMIWVYSSVTLLLSLLATHICAPSNAIPCGRLPTAKVPSVAPVGDSLVTLLPP